MGDLVIRISLMVQRGYICSACGIEIDGQYSETIRQCCDCQVDDAPQQAEPEAAPKAGQQLVQS